MQIKKAFIPVGGFGTRLLPATKAQPKEMLALVDKPVIQYIVEEAVAAGIHDITFITAKGKRAIEDHFDSSRDLEKFLEARGKNELARHIKSIAELAHFTYVRQQEPKGPGDALLQVRHLIGHDPIAVLYADDVVHSKVPCLAQLMRVFEKYQKPVLALERVPKKEVGRYGVIAGKKINARTYRISRLVEKPEIAHAPSNLVIIGKFIYTPDLVDLLPKMTPSATGEFFPTEIFDRYVREGGEMYGYEYEGVRFDCGEKFGFLKASVQAGLRHPEIGNSFRRYLKSIII